MKIIEFNGVDHVFSDGTKPLQNISLSIEEGTLHFVVGPSGSGKTTLLNLLLGLYQPAEGEIWVNECNICLLSERQLTLYRQHIGTVFQQNNLIPHRTVFENVAMPLWLRGTERSEVQRHVVQMLGEVGLSGFEEVLPLHLSSGDQQRVAIARALITSPRIVVADEPTGNLDRQLAGNVTQLLKHQTTLGVTVIMVSHDEELTKYADTISRLEPAPDTTGASTLA